MNTSNNETKENKMKISNMLSANGKKIANQFIVENDTGDSFFQSYDTIIAKMSSGKVYLDENKWNYSTTTGKYRNLFLNETKNQTELKIKSGEYTLINLN